MCHDAAATLAVPRVHSGLRPHELLVRRIYPRVVVVVHFFPDLNTLETRRHDLAQEAHEVSHLTLGVKDDAAAVGEVCIRSVEKEEVRKPGDGDAEKRPSMLARRALCERRVTNMSWSQTNECTGFTRLFSCPVWCTCWRAVLSRMIFLDRARQVVCQRSG